MKALDVLKTASVTEILLALMLLLIVMGLSIPAYLPSIQ
jgi:hypothetical protein